MDNGVLAGPMPRPQATEDLTIVNRRDAAALPALTPHRFSLLYPTTWRSPYPRGNVYSSTFEQCTIDWLARFGLLANGNDLDTLRKLACGQYGGYSSPRSNYRDGLILTQYVSLWLFWDDVVVEQGMEWSVDDVLLALGKGQIPAESDGFVLAWHDLCQRLRRTQGAPWLRRLSVDMGDWMRNAKLETANAARYRSGGEHPGLETMLAIRTLSIGMYPTFHLIEMAEGLELPEDFHQEPHVLELKRLASRLVGFGNDLGGLAKDCLHRWPNLVTAVRQEAGVSTVDAFRAVVDMHNADVEAFDDVEQQLPSWGSQIDVQVKGWVQAVRYSVVGFTLWESVAERYQELKGVVDGRVLSAPVTFHESP